MKRIIISLIIVVATISCTQSQPKVEEIKIEWGKSLTHYTKDFQQSIDIAEKFGLLVYKGKSLSYPISYSEARSLEPCTDYIQVMVKVRPGWIFRLENGEPTAIYLPKKSRWYAPVEFCEMFNKTHYNEFYVNKPMSEKENPSNRLFFILGGILLVGVAGLLIIGAYFSCFMKIKKEKKEQVQISETN